MFKRLITRFLRRIRLSNYFSIGRGNHVRFSCDSRKTRLYVGKGKGNRIQFDDSAITYELTIIIEGNNNALVVAENCYLRGRIELCGEGNQIHIGERSIVGAGLIMAHHGTSISIGTDCLLSGEVNIRTSDSHSILNQHGQRINPEKDIRIGDRVWFGKDVTVMKGCVIGNDVVVGTRSVVSKPVSSNTVVAGIPARVIRENTTWCHQIV